jgi:outer membrane protein assembly factor BamE (lipoprotein component of BamABCDE complex)
MKVFTQVLGGAAVLVALSGCTSIKDHRGYLVDQALVDSVQPGVDNKASVERTLGRPTMISQFGEPVWYYVSMDTHQAAFTSPRAYNELALKIHFDQSGAVSRIDRSGVEKVVHLDPDGHTTPTLGQNRSFLEDLFGNIGTVGSGMGASGPNGDNTGKN